MTRLSTLLRDADPVGIEPQRSAAERRVSRQAVLSSAQTDDERPRRSHALALVSALVLGSIVIGSVYWSRAVVLAAVRFEVRLAEENPAAGLREMITSSGKRVYVHEDTVVTNGDIARAEVVTGVTPSTFNINVTFTTEGAAKMLRASQAHLGKPVAILIDGAVVMAPTIRAPISQTAFISGDYSKAEADRIVAGIIGQ